MKTSSKNGGKFGRDRGPGAPGADREARLAEALKANLRRRKAQARARSKPAEGEGETGGD